MKKAAAGERTAHLPGCAAGTACCEEENWELAGTARSDPAPAARCEPGARGFTGALSVVCWSGL